MKWGSIISHMGACTSMDMIPSDGDLEIHNGGLEKLYHLEDKIGQGKTGVVYRGYNLSTKEPVAIKYVPYAYLNTETRRQAFAMELKLMRKLKHPSIAKLYEIYSDRENFALVTECAEGGEILDIYAKNSELKLSERKVARIVKELAHILRYLHLNGITHRDIKMENLMRAKPVEKSSMRLIDFGLAHRGTKGEKDMTGMAGTIHYMAPEVFGKDSFYDSKVDVWSLGVITYILLYGCYPFDGKFLSHIEDRIKAGLYTAPLPLKNAVSEEAKKFLEYVLVVDPDSRPAAESVLQHPWLKDSLASKEPFTDNHMSYIRSFVNEKNGMEPVGLP